MTIRFLFMLLALSPYAHAQLNVCIESGKKVIRQGECSSNEQPRTATSALSRVERPSSRLGGEVVSSPSDIKPGTRSFAYLFSREQSAQLYNVGVFWDKTLGLQKGCSSEYRVKTVSLSIIDPISFPENGLHPIQGRWQHRFTFERCGTSKIYNAIFIARTGEKPDAKPYFPGESIASPQLVADAMTAATVTAFGKLAKEGRGKCEGMSLAETSISQKAHDVVDRGSVFRGVWQERWVFAGCGQPVDVLVDFIPDGKGGATFVAK